MPIEKSDLLQGTLDMLILKIVELGPVHGYGHFPANPANLQGSAASPARVAVPCAASAGKNAGGLPRSGASPTTAGRRSFYKLSVKGRNQLASEESNWHRLAGAVGHILQTAE